MGKTTTLHVRQAFFVHFLTFPEQLRLEITKISSNSENGKDEAINSTISV